MDEFSYSPTPTGGVSVRIRAKRFSADIKLDVYDGELFDQDGRRVGRATVAAIEPNPRSKIRRGGNTRNTTPIEDIPTTTKQKARGLIGHAKAEFRIGRAADQQIQVRKAACMACDQNDLGRCRAKGCGCYLYDKIRIASERCPKGEW